MSKKPTRVFKCETCGCVVPTNPDGTIPRSIFDQGWDHWVDGEQSARGVFCEDVFTCPPCAEERRRRCTGCDGIGLQRRTDGVRVICPICQ
jgi:hypothetical protein